MLIAPPSRFGIRAALAALTVMTQFGFLPNNPLVPSPQSAAIFWRRRLSRALISITHLRVFESNKLSASGVGHRFSLPLAGAVDTRRGVLPHRLCSGLRDLIGPVWPAWPPGGLMGGPAAGARSGYDDLARARRHSQARCGGGRARRARPAGALVRQGGRRLRRGLCAVADRSHPGFRPGARLSGRSGTGPTRTAAGSSPDPGRYSRRAPRCGCNRCGAAGQPRRRCRGNCDLAVGRGVAGLPRGAGVRHQHIWRFYAVMTNTIYDIDLDRNPANFQPLTPLSFLQRAAAVFPQRTAIVHGARTWTYEEFYARARRLASALARHGVGRGDTVSVVLANTPAMLDAHYGVAMTGAVLNTLNTRLDAAILAFTLDHAETKALITDREYSKVVKDALGLAKTKPLVIDYDDAEYSGPGERLGAVEYEDFLQQGDLDFAWPMPGDEWDAISLNYTSGTTGDPKGVVYHHRGAYLLAIGNVLTCAMGRHPVYLWTLPMFHCNGWCFPWTVSVVAGVHVCLRQVRAAPIYDAISRHKVTHLCGAPIVMSTLLNAAEVDKKPLPHTVEFVTAAAPPPEAVLAAMRAAGFNVTHVYGLTEVYGPASINEWRQEWDALPAAEQAALKARQGVRYPVLEDLDVLDPETMRPVARDGETLGEVMFRGNVVMRGYLKNKAASDKAFAGGWFHSGDLAVAHPDGYIQIKDRSKDIIISGGENISSIEVEDALYRHPCVLEAAVVARPDPNWGETPCAFVTLKDGAATEAGEIIEFCRERLAHFKAPRHVIFGPLPKTATGKIQKFVLRERAKTAV